MYNKDIMERFISPKYAGIIRGANGVGSAQDPNTNEMIKFYINVNEDAVICEAKFKAFGSPVVIAVADATAQMIIGMPIIEAEELNEARVLNMFDDIPQERMYSIFLAIDALNDTIDDYAKRLRKLQNKLLKEQGAQQQSANENAELLDDDYYDN